MLFVPTLVLTLLLSLSVTVQAGPHEDAYEATQRGDFETAYKIFKPLAEQGDADAQFNLGMMYDYGKSVPHDYGEALKWYRKSAVQGDARAQNNLGSLGAFGVRALLFFCSNRCIQA